MKKPFYLLIIVVSLVGGTALGQNILANKYLDTAVAYQRTVKNYIKALKYYELAIKSGNDGNYTFYNAAQCACQTGNTEKAINYYKKSFANYMDYGNYEFFATDTLIKCFNQTPEWKSALAVMKKKYDSVNTVINNYKVDINDKAKRLNRSAISDSAHVAALIKNKSPKEILAWIKNYNSFKAPPIKNHGIMYYIKVDTLNVPFFVYIPETYDPTKKTKLYVFLHGGVSMRPSFQTVPMLSKDDNQILKKPIDNNCIIIYPQAKKGFNWLYTPNAFETILKEVSFVKGLYNIDDDRVYLGGHSDGGTGTFWMATHKPEYFASFLGLNYNDRSYFNNTNLGNLRNNFKFYGLSGAEDNVFNITGVNNVKDYGLSIGDNWHGFTIKNADHGMPYYAAALTHFVYDSLFNQTRNPFPKNIIWETDDVRNGKYAWLEITRLDTLAQRADWHKTYNPPPVLINGKTIYYDFNPRKSGAVMASITGNLITIRQSRVKELIFYASPELVDLHKPVKIIINGKLVYNAFIKADKKIMIDEFIKTKDRQIVVFNKVKILL